MTILTRRVLCTAALLSPTMALAHGEVRAGDLVIATPWTRAAGANANGAAYLTLRNAGEQPDRLLSATTPFARRIELHSMIRDGAVMRMRPVEDIPVPAGGTVELRPGGMHVMMIGLSEPLRQGAEVPLVLRFERAGEVRIMLRVQAAGASSAGHAH